MSTATRKPLSFARLFSRALVIAVIYLGYLATLNEHDLPPLQNGDLVFQSTVTDQSLAIVMASSSIYIHTGIIADNGNGNYTVIEAGRHVQETPLATWISRGVLQRFSLYRYEGLTPEQGGKIVATAREYIGHPYDFYFSSGEDEIYCSELDYLAFNKSGVPLATPEKIGTLNINNRYVKDIIKQRWQNYPACKQQENLTFEQCYDIIMQGDIITPQTVANDPHLKKLFSNYY